MVIKQLLRTSRKSIKNPWKKKYGRKPHYWCASTKRTLTRNFYLQHHKIPEQLYNAHEAVFFGLIHHAVKDLTQFGIIASAQDTAFLLLLKKVFGNNPTREHQRRFFSHPAIIAIWFSATGFKTTKDYQDVLDDLETHQIGQLRKHFARLQLNNDVI